jgi:SET domain-containing protein
VRQVRNSLESYGIDEISIFPDLESLGRAVTLHWKSDTRCRPDDGVYTRLGRSKIHGVGVFAIRSMRAGMRLFKDNRYGCPPSFNRLTPAWYINDSRTNPNVRCDENYEFLAIRDIRRGEELTVDYSQYSDAGTYIANSIRRSPR